VAESIEEWVLTTKEEAEFQMNLSLNHKTIACSLGLLTLAASASAAQQSVKAWGANASGQLGNGETSDRATPAEASLSNVSDLASGQAHSLARQVGGFLWASGSNAAGQLGDGTNDQRSTPVMVLDEVKAIAAGANHSLAVRNDGSVWAWGDNSYGQLGLGDFEPRNAPEQILALEGLDVIAVAAGNQHSLALLSDGTVRAWGGNFAGQLGDGSFDFSAEPKIVADLDGVVKIAAGGFHNLALRSNGRVRAWGLNNYGQLGNGETSNGETYNVGVINLTKVTDISAGGLHSMAIRQNGSVSAWGYNEMGQLGDGTFASKSAPIQVSRISDAVKIDGGYFHSLAVLSDGSVRSWGDNSNGQLGDGSYTNRKRPVVVENLADVIAIEGGDNFTLAVSE
jgi:alpha-tubulin suppressor-like RCC1 family protein